MSILKRARDFPIEIFPEWMRVLATRISYAMRVPVSLPATCMLGIVSVAVRGRVDVVLDERRQFKTGTNMYFLIAAPPGSAKTPVFNMLGKRLHQEDANLINNHKVELAQWKAQQRAAEKRQKTIEKKLDSELTSSQRHDLENELAKLVADQDPCPLERHLLIDDCTAEAIVWRLSQSDGECGLFLGEGAGAIDGIAQYKNGRIGTDLEPLLRGYDGEQIKVERKGGEPKLIVVPEPRLSVCLGLQTQVLQRLLSNQALVERGLFDRFILLQSELLGGQKGAFRSEIERLELDDSIPQELLDRWHQFVEDLLSIQRLPEGKRHALQFADEDVFDQWRRMSEEWDSDSSPGGPYEKIPGFVSKSEARMGRLAGLLHLVTYPRDWHCELISGKTLQNAARLIDHSLEQFLRIRTLFADSSGKMTRLRAFDWIVDQYRKSGSPAFEVRDMQTRFRPRLRAHELRPILDSLVDHGVLGSSKSRYELTQASQADPANARRIVEEAPES